MRKPETYLHKLDGAIRTLVAEIVREAQSDAYQAGYKDASENLFRIATETKDKVDTIIDQSLHPEAALRMN